LGWSCAIPAVGATPGRHGGEMITRDPRRARGLPNSISATLRDCASSRNSERVFRAVQRDHPNRLSPSPRTGKDGRVAYFPERAPQARHAARNCPQSKFSHT